MDSNPGSLKNSTGTSKLVVFISKHQFIRYVTVSGFQPGSGFETGYVPVFSVKAKSGPA